ncbi:MAG: MobA/MobL family protein, partial [Acetobacteraceae bacterium]|nr:MobA/MobL family protein [Acetobacteraceae bacterium]
MIDERTGELHNYSRNADDVLFAGLYAPKDAPEWARDRASLWNHMEAFEKRKDAQVARAFEIALPCELTPEQARYAVQDWVRENFTRKGLIADVAIHRPGAEGDERNIHAHVLVVMRKLDGAEFAAKKERAASFAERTEELETW